MFSICFYNVLGLKLIKTWNLDTPNSGKIMGTSLIDNWLSFIDDLLPKSFFY